MEISKHKDHFVKFPYRRETRDNGDINNGGIDLVKEPHRINEIHELAGAPWLKSFISALNDDGGYFMSFGCVYGPEADCNMGYVDFSFRPEVDAHRRHEIINLDIAFYDYLTKAMDKAENPEAAINFARSSLVWERSPLEIYGETYEKVTITFAYRDQAGVEWLFDHLQYFLTVYYPSLPQP